MLSQRERDDQIQTKKLVSIKDTSYIDAHFVKVGVATPKLHRSLEYLLHEDKPMSPT